MSLPAILQLVSPSLPVGAFSYSEGIEYLAQSEKITNEDELIIWIQSELERGQLRLEASAISPIMDCLKDWKDNKTNASRERVYEWNSWLQALRDSEEVRFQQRQMGQSLLQILSELNFPLPNNTKNLTWTIAWAWAGVNWSLPKIEMVQGYLYSWVSNQLNVALRVIPIGPNKVQTIQFNLNPMITTQAKHLLNKDPHQLWTGDIGATMAQQSHAELYSKLFRS